MAKEKSRKELLKQDDAFLHAAQQGAEWAKENRNVIIAGSIAVVVLITAVWGGAEFIRLRNLEASRRLEEALTLSRGQVVTEGANPSADPPTFASAADQQRAVMEKMQAVVDASGGRNSGYLARLVIADLQEKMGNPEAAQKGFAELCDELSTDHPLYFVAVERAAYLQEKQGDRDGAIRTFGRLAGRPDAFYGDVATYQQGRLQQAKGDLDKARALYEEVEDNLTEPPFKDELKRRLNQVGRSKPAPSDEVSAAPDAAAPAAAASAQGAVVDTAAR